MAVVPQGIHLVLSDEEADVVMQALANWGGPYDGREDRCNETEKQLHANRLELAAVIRDEIFDAIMGKEAVRIASEHVLNETIAQYLFKRDLL